MASYKETVGTAGTNYAGNNPAVLEGELWYDSTNKDFKYQYPSLTATGSWRTGPGLLGWLDLGPMLSRSCGGKRSRLRGFGSGFGEGPPFVS